MKITQLIRFNVHAFPTACLALCTGLALSAASARADDDKDKNKDRGSPGTEGRSQAGQSSQFKPEEEKFVKEALKGGMVEVRMGRMAVERAQNSQVRDFGQRLVEDHRKAGQELRQLATRKGLQVPEPGESIAGIDADHSTVRGDADKDNDKTQVREKDATAAAKAKGEEAAARAHLKKLGELSGTEFDREFVSMAMKDHRQDISEFEKASEKCEDAELKAWIQKTLPTLRAHLQTAQRLQAQIGGSTTTTPGTTDNQSNP